jgi:hypothetical protein
MAKEMLNTVYADEEISEDGQFLSQIGTGPDFRDLVTRINNSNMSARRKRRLKRLVGFLAELAENKTTRRTAIFFTVKATPIDGGQEYIRLHDTMEEQTYLFNNNPAVYDVAAVEADPTLLDPSVNPQHWTLEE